MRPFPAFLLLSMLVIAGPVRSQCGANEAEVFIEVDVDAYGYETYWELLPNGSPCGTGTIFAGSNALVGCTGAGLELQQQGGYGNNITVTEGPWCLADGAAFDIFWADDWGDGGLSFTVIVDGVPSAQFTGGNGSPAETFTFIVQQPPARDIAIQRTNTPLFVAEGEDLLLTGDLRNEGSTTAAMIELIYVVDGSVPVSAVVNANLAPGQVMAFAHPIPWAAVGLGMHQIEVYPGLIDGLADGNAFNDSVSFGTKVHTPAPNIIDQYLVGNPVVSLIADSDEDILVPRDLDFHPDPERNELWVLNKDVEATGGSTVTFFNPGEADMDFMWKRDPNAWHFMSLPTALAMADNGFFATSPGVFDANHNGGDPFTGPSLWSADTAIYADVIYGPLGSHFDMLHVNPSSQGIAHERWNRYWVVDGHSGDIVMNDFTIDHGPGNDYHGNAIIRRYADFTITKDPNDHVVSHAVMDKASGWLYVVDHGGQRVLRLDTRGGTVTGPGNYGPWETYAEYSMVSGYAWDVVVDNGLVQPAGIDLIGDRMLVSDHANGDIVIYDIASMPAVELGRIQTGNAGLMGIKIGPDGRVWGVNATFHQLLRVEPGMVTSIKDDVAVQARAYPSPTEGALYVQGLDGVRNGESLEVLDMAGQRVRVIAYEGAQEPMDMTGLAPGMYHLRSPAAGVSMRFVMQ